MKTVVAEPRDDDEDEEGDVTKTITLQEVHQDFENWISALKEELDSQYTKECLIPRNLEEVKELQRTSDKKVKILPAKLVATKKKKARKPVRNKARIVACGCYDHDEAGTKETYAGGADITAIRSAIRTAALENWTIRTKDVSTAFLNAPYEVEGEMMFLVPPKVYVRAGLVKDDEVWQVNKAIYGLQESPLLWAKERDRKLKDLTFQLPKYLEGRGKDMQKDDFDEFYLQRLNTDVNTWHILKNGEKESQGILLTYVDDLMVVTTEEIGEALMKKIDEIWKC